MRYFAVSALLLFASGGAFAQTNSGAQVLTLDEAIRQSLEKNYTVKTGSLTVERSELERDRARANMLPDASANARYGYGYDLGSAASRTFTRFDAASGQLVQEVTPAGSNSLSYNVGSSINLYAGGGDAARIRSAERNLEASAYSLDWLKQSTIFNVTSAYVNALRSRELVQSAEKTLSESRAQLDRVRALHEAGSIAIGQVYQQEAVVGQNELSQIQAQNNYENAKADLLFLLDVPPTDFAKFDVSLSGVDTTTTATRREAVRTRTSQTEIDRLIGERPDIAALRSRIAAAEATIDVVRSALYPRLDANVGVGGSGANSDLTRTQINNGLNAGLTLSVPLFDRMQNRIQIEQLKLDIEADQIQLRQAEQGIRTDVARATNNLRSAEQALDASERALRAAEESLRLAQERVRVGAGIQLDVIVAQSQLETARTNRVNSVYNYVLAQRQVAYTLGQPQF